MQHSRLLEPRAGAHRNPVDESIKAHSYQLILDLLIVMEYTRYTSTKSLRLLSLLLGGGPPEMISGTHRYCTCAKDQINVFCCVRAKVPKAKAAR